MKAIQSFAFGLLICVVLVNARQHGERHTDKLQLDLIDNNDENNEEHVSDVSDTRHKRKRRNGYRYPLQYSRFDDRRDVYDLRQHDVLFSQILSYLDDIATNLKRPTTYASQPSYVPYPIYIPSQCCNCKTGTPDNTPDVPKNLTFKRRWPEMDDVNQNWGVVEESRPPKQSGREYDYDEDGARPIDFTPVKPRRPLSRAQPDVDRGSSQAAMTTTEAPRNHVHDGRVMASSGTRLSTSCDGAILSCCKPSDTRNMQLQCLAKFGCLHAFSGGAACDPQSIQNIMKSLNREYSTHNG